MSNNRKQGRMSQIPRAVVNESPDVKCLECEGIIFIPGQKMKKISAIISLDGLVKYVHIPVLICFQCHTILPEKP